MKNDFADFWIWMFMIIDEIMRKLEILTRRSVPVSICNDTELIKLAIVGEFKGWDVEIEVLSEWKKYPHQSPNMPTQSRFNRKQRNLMGIIKIINPKIGVLTK